MSDERTGKYGRCQARLQSRREKAPVRPISDQQMALFPANYLCASQRPNIPLAAGPAVRASRFADTIGAMDMLARTVAVLCAVLMPVLLPTRATAADGVVKIAQAVSGGATQGDGSTPSSVAKPAQNPPDQRAAFQLSGVIIGPDVKYAILKHLTTNKTRKVQLGEEIDGWTAEEIASDYVLLRREDKRIRVELSTRRGVVGSGGSSPLPNRPVRPPPPQQATPSPSYSRAPAAQNFHALQQQRAAQRAQLAAERNARRLQEQQRLATCRLQADQQRLKRQSRRAFIASCRAR